ncbi:General stress protein A, partial [Haemophilus influenzae]
KIKIYYT